MDLQRAYTGIRILETAHNFSRVDEPLTERPEQLENDSGRMHFISDAEFWGWFHNNKDACFGVKCIFNDVIVSEWIPRIPGLFWTPKAAQLRRLRPAAYEEESEQWKTLAPPGKSSKVSGGIGTLRLPPAIDGTQLITITTMANVSAGIPALASEEVIKKISQRGSIEGQVIECEARWQKLPLNWASQFRLTKGVSRACLVLDDPQNIFVYNRTCPTQIHPFTIMEYRTESFELFDYVFATADTGDPNYRNRLEAFFDNYKTKNNRFGRYWTPADVVKPMWDSIYNLPQQLIHTDTTMEAPLRLLEKRVEEKHFGTHQTEEMMEVLTNSIDNEADLYRISLDIGINPIYWQRNESLARLYIFFIDAVLEGDKMSELIDVLADQYPHLVRK
ncbi:MAG: hypothetical protein ACRBF0_13990 [Calditrichia bacterium]